MIAVNKLVPTPIARVKEKPFTILAPKVLPKMYRTRQVSRVEAFESRIDGQARDQPRSIAGRRVRPARSSSFSLSKIKYIGVYRHTDA